MACKTSYELHHHFPRLAEESGFTFNTHRPRIHIDWNKIRLIDIDSLIRDRKFVVIEQHLNDILDCVFESEFDVRILDEGVMKMFRLAQLAVEYQQFCRHYLDRSVYVMKEEISALAQELDSCKKEIREKDEELRKLRKRSRHSYKNPLPYGNDNIATMILKTLTHKSDLHASTSNENLQYNKCNYCEKVFLNQLYLKSHISRRHLNIMETPQKDKHENDSNNENTRLSAEIAELRNKLKEMEVTIANASNQAKPTNETNNKEPQIQLNTSAQEIEGSKKEMRDTAVATNNEDYLMNKIEEWKKEEHENYNKEINNLRNQIMETINTLKEKDCQKSVVNESIMIEQLHATIKQQGKEIIALQQELTNSRVKAEKDNADRNKEAETQISFWAKQAKDQSKQYEELLQKLNDVAKDAKESRALAEAETQRAAQLQALLTQSLNNKMVERAHNTDNVLIPNHKPQLSNGNSKPVKKKQYRKRPNESSNNKTFEMLQRKAQELLSIGSVSSTSSEVSSADKVKPFQMKTTDVKDKNKIDVNDSEDVTKNSNEKSKAKHIQTSKKSDVPQILNKKESKKEKLKSRSKKIEEIPNSILPGSPVKVVRAKITEEVNNRLVSAGVDPLKSRLPQNVFQKKRTQIQQQQELKNKKNPTHEKVRHSILAYLDSSTTNMHKDVINAQEYTSPNKDTAKPFYNFTSMISNVKSKALSLVKLNDTNARNKRKSPDTGVAKRALSLLKTPPGSASNSPVTMRQSPIITNPNLTHNLNISNVKAKSNHDIPNVSNKAKNNPPSSPKIKDVVTYDTDGESEESEHKYYNSTQQSSKSIENLIKSPARRPSSATTDYGLNVRKYTVGSDNLLRTQSATNLAEQNRDTNVRKKSNAKDSVNSSDDVESISEAPVKKNFLEDNTPNIVKQTKGVLKNASSTSSLNKKKVLFDMDAIQMKSVSASPSQSITERSDGNEKYELGLVNLDGEEWDISSIDNEPLKPDTKIQNVTRTSPKIAELKEKIESQLARRNTTPTIPLAGKVDVLAGAMGKASSIGGGSNTSLGSSILDDSDSAPVVTHKAFVKPKKITVKEDSDIDISEFSIDGIVNKNESF